MSVCQESLPGRLQKEKNEQAFPKARESLRPADYSDVGNAAVFSRVFRNDLAYTDALGWLWWNGHRWERDDHKALVWAMRFSDRMLQEASAANQAVMVKEMEIRMEAAKKGEEVDGSIRRTLEREQKDAVKFLRHAQNLRGARQLKNMMELSAASLVVKAETLDANPFDLNTPAGIVNLATGELRPHERKAWCSRITSASPGEEGNEVWLDFLESVTCGDRSVQGFLQMVAGMALIGAVYQEGIVIAYGEGSNGKSTFFNALSEILGDYAGSIDVRTLTTDRSNKGVSLATLRGKRLVVTGELEEHQRLSAATLKQLGSTDRLNIEEKFKQPESVKQTHTLVLFTNHLPRVGSTDAGTWRRLTVIPFRATFSRQESVQNYGEILAQQAGSAILSWAIQGSENFIRNGFKLDIPDVVEEATEEYRQREDWLNNFIDERCIRDVGSRIGARNLYTEYKSWALDLGDYVRRENDFSAAMLSAGFKKVKINGKPTYYGLRLDCPFPQS